MSNLRNRRKNLRRTAAALTGAAALMALLTACNGTATGSVRSDGGTAAPAAGGSTGGGSTNGSGSTGGSGSNGAGATPNGGTGSGSGGTSGGGSTSGSSSSGGSAAGSSVPACQASQLGYSWAGGDAAAGAVKGSDQQAVVVALTNKSGHTCTLYGFPGVDLVNSGQQWSLQRTNATPQRVTLSNGTAAHFTITYLESNDSDAFAPTTVVITAPNQRTSYDLPWHGGPIVLQDGATHPGTYVGPVGK